MQKYFEDLSKRDIEKYIAMPDGNFKSLPQSHEAVTSVLGFIGNVGFLIALNLTLRGPEYLLSTFPESWQREYEDRNYLFVDPVVYWAMTKTGSKRWSEVTFSSVTPVFRRAREHGLIYGATISTTEGRGRSLLSLARDDRELSDEEIAQGAAFLDQLAAATFGVQLSIEELETLKLASEGLAQKEIAGTLGIAEPTVKARLTKVKDKLGARNTTHAVRIALSNRML